MAPAAKKTIAEPAFVVSKERPTIRINKLGFEQSIGQRSSELTEAILTTLSAGGSVEVLFDEDSHDKLVQRYAAMNTRMRASATPTVITHSFIHNGEGRPIKVLWWCERIAKSDGTTPSSPSAPTTPTTPAREPEVGREVE